MTKKLSLTLLFIVFLSVAGGITYAIFQSILPAPDNSLAGSEENSVLLSQTIDFSGIKPQVTDNVMVQIGETALAILQRTHAVSVKEYSFGTLVEGIDGVMGGTDGKYWIFYLNGSMAPVGAGEYTIAPGDEISWRLEKGE